VDLLCKYCPDLQENHVHREAAFWLSAWGGQVEVIRYFLYLNIDPLGRDEKGDTALYLTAKAGHDDVVEMLLDANADVSSRNNDGDLPLHVAAEYNKWYIVKILLTPETMNERNVDGMTALHITARGGFDDTVEVLLQTKVDTSIRDNKGWIALNYSLEGQHHSITALLAQPESGDDWSESDEDIVS
jgi:ankyrin repeat protein